MPKLEALNCLKAQYKTKTRSNIAQGTPQYPDLKENISTLNFLELTTIIRRFNTPDMQKM